jgi:hypothetical protein
MHSPRIVCVTVKVNKAKRDTAEWRSKQSQGDTSFAKTPNLLCRLGSEKLVVIAYARYSVEKGSNFPSRFGGERHSGGASRDIAARGANRRNGFKTSW